METEQLAADLLMLEYEQLKEEQRLRIGTRDNLVYATLGALTVAIAGVIQAHSPAMLLLLPPVCLVLGWTYLANDDRVTAIGLHVQNVIVPELATLAAPHGPIFGWERHHRADRRRRARKTAQCAVDLVIFCAGAPVALAVVWTRLSPSASLIVVTVLEMAGTAALALSFLGHAVTALRLAPGGNVAAASSRAERRPGPG